MVCVVCDKHHATGNGICHNCNAKLEAGKRRSKADKPVKYATYRGQVIGFFRNGGGKLIPRLVNRNPERLPKSKLINLNTYVEGFTRDQVKRIKSAILQLAN